MNLLNWKVLKIWKLSRTCLQSDLEFSYFGLMWNKGSFIQLYHKISTIEIDTGNSFLDTVAQILDDSIIPILICLWIEWRTALNLSILLLHFLESFSLINDYLNNWICSSLKILEFNTQSCNFFWIIKESLEILKCLELAKGIAKR